MIADTSHLTSLFENATEGIILTNGKGNIVLVNPAAQRMFGYDATELIDHPIETLIPVRLHQHHKQVRDGFYHHPQNRVMGHGRDLFGRCKNGTELSVEVSLSFYRRQGELFVIAFVVDITERKKIESSMLAQQKELEKMATDMRRLNMQLEAKVEERTVILKEALQKLEESQHELSEALEKEKQLNEIKSSFVSLASHEFRTPLSTVMSSASLIGKYTESDQQDKRERHINKIKDSVKHLNNLLEDFLSLGKLEEGKIQAHPSHFDVSEFMEDVVEEMRPIAKTGQEITCQFSGEGKMVTDKNLLKNILINLISNAIKFSPENGKISVVAQKQDNLLKLRVTDNGIGISEEDQEHLFSSFFRGKNAVNIQGTGLGLHIVRRYADLIHATLKLESVLQQGTTIFVEIPDLG